MFHVNCILIGVEQNWGASLVLQHSTAFLFHWGCELRNFWNDEPSFVSNGRLC